MRRPGEKDYLVFSSEFCAIKAADGACPEHDDFHGVRSLSHAMALTSEHPLVHSGAPLRDVAFRTPLRDDFAAPSLRRSNSAIRRREYRANSRGATRLQPAQRRPARPKADQGP